MAVFKREHIPIILTKEEVLEDLLDHNSNVEDGWHIEKFDQNSYFDVLLIKTFKKTTTKYINPGAPNPLHKDKEEEVQIVIAITIDINNEYDREKIFGYTKKWTSHHIITNNLSSIIKVLKKIIEEQS
jgi:hypothetical protein|tara:strand:+ start:10216 stop:10599 length:384 start_codon:yes stop_codon:yes gene_type:complete